MVYLVQDSKLICDLGRSDSVFVQVIAEPGRAPIDCGVTVRGEARPATVQDFARFRVALPPNFQAGV